MIERISPIILEYLCAFQIEITEVQKAMQEVKQHWVEDAGAEYDDSLMLFSHRIEHCIQLLNSCNSRLEEELLVTQAQCRFQDFLSMVVQGLDLQASSE